MTGDVPEQQQLRETLALLAPGTELREGLTRILRGRTGALIVLGRDETLASVCTGGFDLAVDFSATRLRELAKMDGAIVLDRGLRRIRQAAVHLGPDQHLPSDETGTRHRTAHRVAQQTGWPVITVSQSMQVIALYVGSARHVLEDSGQILTRANEALATLERYRRRLDEVAATLSVREIEDRVSVRDVAAMAQRLEMVARTAREVEDHRLELGADGRLLALQLEELVSGVEQERVLLGRDYLAAWSRRSSPEQALSRLASLPPEQLVDAWAVARALGLTSGEQLDGALAPRGYRMLARVRGLPEGVVDGLVTRFGSLQRLLAATPEQLQQVPGVGDLRARFVREGLSRLAESSLSEGFG